MNIANLKIGHRLNISFGLTIAMLAVVVALGASQLAAVRSDIDLSLYQHYAKVDLLNQARNALGASERYLDDAILRGDEALVNAELDKAEASAARVDASLAQLGETAHWPGAAALLGQLASERTAFATVRAQVLGLARSGHRPAASALLLAALRPAQAGYFEAIDRLIVFQAARMLDAGAHARRTANLASSLMIALGILGGVLSLLTAWFITRGIVTPIRHAVKVARTVASGDLGSNIEVRSRDEIGQLSQALKEMNDSLVNIVSQVRSGTDTIAQASSEIADGNHDLSARTEQQAGALEETASSMAQLTSTVRQNADHARQANQLAHSASEVAGHGGVVVQQVVDTMDSINTASRKIVDIIGVIDAIAFQTNILALNAAVEAARAGEHGRGFAVVAGEVRTLAQRSAAAAHQIKALIGASVSEVDAGARLVDQAGRTMADIVGSIARVTDIMREISAASVEQLSGIEQVNAAITQMDQVTQQNAALVEQAAAAAAAMQQQASQLSGVVGVFKIGAERQTRLGTAPAKLRVAARTIG